MPILITIYDYISSLFNKLPNWFTRYKRYYKACISGVMSLCVQLFVFYILRLTMKATTANIIATEIAIITNFLINYHFTFYDHKQKKPAFKKITPQFFTFNLVSLSSMLIQYISLHVELSLLGTHVVYETIAILIGIIIGSMVNFALYKTVVWKKF